VDITSICAIRLLTSMEMSVNLPADALALFWQAGLLADALAITMAGRHDGR